MRIQQQHAHGVVRFYEILRVRATQRQSEICTLYGSFVTASQICRVKKFLPNDLYNLDAVGAWLSTVTKLFKIHAWFVHAAKHSNEFFRINNSPFFDPKVVGARLHHHGFLGRKS